MALEVTITLPAPNPVEGGLLSAARPIEDGSWVRGLIVNSSQCIEGLPYPFCNRTSEGEPVDKETQRPGDGDTFEPVGITVTVDCSTLGGDPQKFAEQGLDLLREYTIATELAAGTVTANPALADASGVGSGVGAKEALAVLEDEIALVAQGRQAFVHVSPGNMVRIEGALRWTGTRWLTPNGNVVVSSPGYTTLTDLHATGEVFTGVGGRANLSSIDRNVNTRYVTAEELGIAVFDPCFNIAVSIEDPSST